MTSLHPRLSELDAFLRDGFDLVDIRSDASGMEVDLRKDLLLLTLRIDRREAAEILRDHSAPGSLPGRPSVN